MKLKKYLIFIFFIMLCTILSISFLFISCNKKTIQGISATDKMIGEMIILGFRGTEIDDSSKIVKDIINYNIGGVILFDYDVPSKSSPRNIISPKQTKKLIEDIKKLTRQDLLVAVDAEGEK